MESTLSLRQDLSRSGASLARYDALIILALVVDLLTPYLIWQTPLPAATRWLSHLAVAAMMGIAVVRMLIMDHVPRAVLVIGGMSAIGVTVAILEGQGIIPTLWGWWILFQYPMVGLYVYLRSTWPEHFPQRFRQLCLGIVVMEALFQIGQYLTGWRPGDDTAGTFGQHGATPLALFILFTLCIALGRWLVHGRWKMITGVLAFGSVSAVLAEMKLVPFAAVALGGLSAILLVGRRKRVWSLVLMAVLLVVWVLAFIRVYDEVLVSYRGARSLGQYLDLGNLAYYLGGATRTESQGVSFAFGRNYALSYGWNVIRRETTTFLFGMGLGARGESRTLGTAGVGLLRARYGLHSGTSLLVMMQELGLWGLVVGAGVILWIVVTLLRDIRQQPHSEATELRYGLLLFTLMWPVWLWYSSTWTMRVPMLLYWVALGYVLGEADRQRARDLGRHPRHSVRQRFQEVA